MGLDQYLIVKNDTETLKEARERFDEVCYWRKDYPINEWFTMNGYPIKDREIYDNVTWEESDITWYFIKRDKLKDLIRDLLNAIDDQEHPLYDDLDNKSPIENIISLLKALNNPSKQFLYHASW